MVHGPRYSVKGKPNVWVNRDSKGRFKNWVKKKRSLSSDRVWKARKPIHHRKGYGATRDN